MSKNDNIKHDLKAIGNYLETDKQYKFSIPEYQRAYSWEIKHCDKLWQDIDDFMLNGGKNSYFFGTIIINVDDENGILSLIDGQQRTTTFILLYKALLLRINKAIKETARDEDSADLNYGLSKKRDRLIQILYKVSDDEILSILKNPEAIPNETILENNSINELYKDELQTIINGKDFESIEENTVEIKYKRGDNRKTNFYKNFKFFYEKLEKLSPSKVNTFTEYILNKSEIIEIRSWNVEQAISMFNSLNSDGMPLLDADIISAKLYSESGDLREDFNEKWTEFKNIVSELEKSNITDIDNILTQLMYIKRSSDKASNYDKYPNYETVPGVRRYYTELNKELLKNPIKLVDDLLKISNIWFAIKDYSIIKLFNKLNKNYKFYLISYLNRFEPEEITKDLVTEFVDSLLKLFAILEVVDAGYSSGYFKSYLFKLNLKLVDKNIDISEIKKDLYDHINKNWSKDDIFKSIKDYKKNAIVYLNEYIACKNMDIKFDLSEANDIEHIMPDSGKNIDQIREDAGINDKEEFIEIVDKLGNKMLLEADINRSIGNAWFRTKIQNSIKEKRGYKDSRFALAKQILSKFEGQEFPLWTVADIEENTNIAADRISNYIFS